MTEKQQPNTLREGLSTKAVPQPCAVVIFGATGDLTHRKLVPAIYNIAADGELPPAVAVVGFARRPKRDEEFRQEMEATRKFSRQTVRDEILERLASSSITRASLATKPVTRNRGNRLDKESGTRDNRLFYTSRLRRISSKRSCKSEKPGE
jgi:glucose-6-phosphate 1-dehydrogenase